MPKVTIDLTPPRGRVIVTPSWTMSIFERAKGFPGRTRMVEKTLYFELTDANIAYAKSAFPQGHVIGDSAAPKNLVDGPRMPFATAYPPTDLQREALDRAGGKETFAFFEKPGAGKTKIVLDKAVKEWCNGRIDGLFVLTFAYVHEQWVLDEIPKHLHSDIPWEAASFKPGVSHKRYNEILKPKKDVFRVFTMNYEAFAVSAKAFDLAKQFAASGAIMAALDESHRIKQHDSKVSECAANHRELWPQRLIATGSPTPLGIQDYYSQFRFLEPQIIGSLTWEGFKATYCRMGGYENTQVIGYHNQDLLHERMAPYVHVGEPKIPFNQIYEVQRFSLTPKLREIYSELRQELTVTVNDERLYRATNPLALTTKLQEVTAGRITGRDGVTRWLSDERLRFLDVILQMNEGQKAIIWSRFKLDHEAQAERLGDRALVYNGDTPKGERRKVLDAFKDPGSGVDYLLASAAALGTGVDGLQGLIKLNIYYNNSHNGGQREQSERRTFRLGVDNDVRYIDIVARSTIDVGVLNSNKRKKDIGEMSMEEFRSMIEEENVLEDLG